MIITSTLTFTLVYRGGEGEGGGGGIITSTLTRTLVYGGGGEGEGGIITPRSCARSAQCDSRPGFVFGGCSRPGFVFGGLLFLFETQLSACKGSSFNFDCRHVCKTHPCDPIAFGVDSMCQ